MTSQQELIKSLQAIPWFQMMTPEHFNKIASIAKICKYEPGQVIFHEGDKEDYLYVVLEGRVQRQIAIRSIFDTPMRFSVASLRLHLGRVKHSPLHRRGSAENRAPHRHEPRHGLAEHHPQARVGRELGRGRLSEQPADSVARRRAHLRRHALEQ